ncbi:MAG: hypothetical protein H6Q86_2335, partial [candidate division NC10 bacterium]|nr:hypothetical protein [candidate division NC10 bacterium]
MDTVDLCLCRRKVPAVVDDVVGQARLVLAAPLGGEPLLRLRGREPARPRHALDLNAFR